MEFFFFGDATELKISDMAPRPDILCPNFIFPLNGGDSIIKQAVFGEKVTNLPEHHFIYIIYFFIYLCYCFCFTLNVMYF